MKKSLFLVFACLVICLFAYRFGGAKMDDAKRIAMERMYLNVSQLVFPQLHLYDVEKEELVYRDVEKILMPVVACFRGEMTMVSHGSAGALSGQEADVDVQEQGDVLSETETGGTNELMGEMDSEYSDSEDGNDESAQTSGFPVMQKQVEINRAKLADFDYLRQNFYQVDNTTTVSSTLLDAAKFLEKDMTLKGTQDGPQILIYHTHSQEAYADSVAGDAGTSVVALGDYLEQILEGVYGIEVLHHKGQYDVENRNAAYSNALPHLEQILEENPSIEVVIDLHRDGVPENLHLVSEVNGKQTAQIMFFNGLSRTTSQGELAYLANPYIEDNLAFSFQLQLAADEYYPGFARNIYLKGYRYNLHLCPKSILVEIGAQNNTFEEAKNAMEPLANILAKVLLENY